MIPLQNKIKEHIGILPQLILATDQSHHIIESNHTEWRHYDQFVGQPILYLIETMSQPVEMARFEGYLELQLEKQEKFLVDFEILIQEGRLEKHRLTADPYYGFEGFEGYLISLHNIDASNFMVNAYCSNDPISELFDRTFGERMIQGLFKRRIQTGNAFTIVGFEIAGFLIIKDSYGSTVANSLIKQAADLVKSAVRHSDTPYYVDDGQFNVICMSSSDLVKPMVDRVIKKAQQTFIKEIATQLQFKVALVSTDEITNQNQLIHLLDMRLNNC